MEIDINELKGEIIPTQSAVESYKREIKELEKRYTLILTQTVNEKSLDSRTAELEIKMAKLWDLLTDKTEVRKNTKLTKFGKRFKERFKR